MKRGVLDLNYSKGSEKGKAVLRLYGFIRSALRLILLIGLSYIILYPIIFCPITFCLRRTDPNKSSKQNTTTQKEKNLPQS